MIPPTNTPEYRFAVDKAKDTIEHAHTCEDPCCEKNITAGEGLWYMLMSDMYGNPEVTAS